MNAPKTAATRDTTNDQRTRRSWTLIGQSPAITGLRKIIHELASTPIPVLLTGESGVGKNVIANALHESSGRTGELVELNCATIPDTLAASELFGHTKGSFTDARGSDGLISRADGGTLFLDEITLLSPHTQAMFLTVLDRGIYRKVGASASFSASFRLISATNQDVETLVSERKFREDLLHRIGTIRLTIPPLRDRLEDVHLLVAYALEGTEITIEERALKRLVEASREFRGNVRQLLRTIEVACVFARSNGRIIDLNNPAISDLFLSRGIIDPGSLIPKVESPTPLVAVVATPPPENAKPKYELKRLLSAIASLENPFKINMTEGKIHPESVPILCADLGLEVDACEFIATNSQQFADAISNRRQGVLEERAQTAKRVADEFDCLANRIIANLRRYGITLPEAFQTPPVEQETTPVIDGNGIFHESNENAALGKPETDSITSEQIITVISTSHNPYVDFPLAGKGPGDIAYTNLVKSIPGSTLSLLKQQRAVIKETIFNSRKAYLIRKIKEGATVRTLVSEVKLSDTGVTNELRRYGLKLNTHALEPDLHKVWLPESDVSDDKSSFEARPCAATSALAFADKPRSGDPVQPLVDSLRRDSSGEIRLEHKTLDLKPTPGNRTTERPLSKPPAPKSEGQSIDIDKSHMVSNAIEFLNTFGNALVNWVEDTEIQAFIDSDSEGDLAKAAAIGFDVIKEIRYRQRKIVSKVIRDTENYDTAARSLSLEQARFDRLCTILGIPLAKLEAEVSPDVFDELKAAIMQIENPFSISFSPKSGISTLSEKSIEVLALKLPGKNLDRVMRCSLMQTHELDRLLEKQRRLFVLRLHNAGISFNKAMDQYEIPEIMLKKTIGSMGFTKKMMGTKVLTPDLITDEESGRISASVLTAITKRVEANPFEVPTTFREFGEAAASYVADIYLGNEGLQNAVLQHAEELFGEIQKIRINAIRAGVAKGKSTAKIATELKTTVTTIERMLDID